MYNLAVYYKNGKETEKDFEKAIYWYQKAAQNENLLQNSYVKENIKKFTSIEYINNLENSNYNICNSCYKKRKPLQYHYGICIICYQSKLLFISSGNKFVDEFIKHTQIYFIQE